MKVKIEIASGASEPEVLIRCERLDESVIALQNYILEQSHSSQVFMLRQGETEYYIPVKDILFFETEGRTIAAHTKDGWMRRAPLVLQSSLFLQAGR